MTQNELYTSVKALSRRGEGICGGVFITAANMALAEWERYYPRYGECRVSLGNERGERALTALNFENIVPDFLGFVEHPLLKEGVPVDVSYYDINGCKIYIYGGISGDYTVKYVKAPRELAIDDIGGQDIELGRAGQTELVLLTGYYTYLNENERLSEGLISAYERMTNLRYRVQICENTFLESVSDKYGWSVRCPRAGFSTAD